MSSPGRDPASAAEARFRPVRELGRGAMGSVELVHDTYRGHRVARKRAMLADSKAVVRFKREFRELERLRHPNLVRVFELGEDAEGLYFTMEFVDGQPIDAFVRARARDTALATTLPGLLAALAHIHGAGIVHRDLKPTNVLVSAEGVVKVLDFGVLGRVEDREGVAAGTPGFMAPEQIRGQRPGPESDLYALGALLFELCAGRPVFEGTRAEVVEQHLGREPPRLADRVPGIARALDLACARLLRKQPEDRPKLGELAELLSPVIGTSSRSFGARPALALIGREELVRAAHEIANAGRHLVLTGPSGVGKSAVASALAHELEDTGWVVLASGARPTERVAFNAVDSAIDELARRLEQRLEGDPELQRSARESRNVFPALALAGVANADRTRELVRFRLFGRAKPVSRVRAFDAVRVLFQRLAPRVALLIDDFQWADADSLALLGNLLATKSQNLVLIVVLRDDVEAREPNQWLDAEPSFVRLAVRPLSDSALAEIAAHEARVLGVDPDPEALEACVRSASGRALLAEIGGRALATHGSPELEQVVKRADALEREVLAYLVAADDWTDPTLLGELTGRSAGRIEDALSALVDAGLARRGGHHGPSTSVDVFHDGIRRAAGNALMQALPSVHSKLADHWLSSPNAPSQRAVRHLLEAGRQSEAARVARHAATAAEEQHAYGLAADMYGVALLEPSVDAAELQRARATALGKVGRYREAARSWGALAASAGAEQSLDYALHEATALVAAGCTAQGLDRLDATIARAGETPVQSRNARALLCSASFVLGPGGRHLRRFLAPPSAGNLRSAERDVRLGILLCFIDPASGVRYLLRASDAFRRAGASGQEAVCNYMFAVLALVGSRAARVPLAEKYLRVARELCRSRPDPMTAAMAEFVHGLEALRRGTWDGAARRLDAAAAQFERTGAVTEQLMAASWRSMSDVYSQDLFAMRRHVAWFRNNLEELGGGIIAAHVDLLEGYVRHLEGDWAQSERLIVRIRDAFAGPRPNVQSAGAELYRHLSAIYRDDPGAKDRFYRALARARPFRLLHTMYAGPFAMIGGLLEANAARRGEPASRRRAERFAAIIDAAPPLPAGVSFRIRAYFADASGRPEAALRQLEQAESVAAGFGRSIDAGIARFQRGLRLGGDTGRELCESARVSIAERGASERVLYEDAGLR